MNRMNINFFSRKALGIVALAALPFLSFAQKPNWQNLDLKTDSTFGISTEKAYNELLKGKKSKPVIVGVLDGGVDYNHEDLKRIMWVNKKDKPNDHKDNDKNGYVDDIHGWNFLGSAKGSVNQETLEMTRIIRRDKARFENVDTATLSDADRQAYEIYKSAKADYDSELAEAKEGLQNIEGFKNALDAVVKKIGKEKPTAEDFQNFKPETGIESRIQNVMAAQLKNSSFEDFYNNQIMSGYNHFKDQIDYNLNMDFNPRPELVGDNYANSQERYYGNNDIAGPDAMHGTHVSGIIAADRTNDLGIKGVANNVKIMGVRAVPNGDERDKDVANAIRYAVDNGAKVLNMSFGKAYSWDKEAVDSAVKYAMSKDVLLVQAAGNDNKNLDIKKSFPDRKYVDGGIAGAYLVVGASGWVDDATLKASFSNYGKTTVDVFAPGVNIYSTVPGSKYRNLNGTSMASPVVAGLAALIRSYYPKLSAQQVKDIIMKSVTKVDHNVNVSIDGETQSIPFSDLCISGGIVNAYNALKLAAETR